MRRLEYPVDSYQRTLGLLGAGRRDWAGSVLPFRELRTTMYCDVHSGLAVNWYIHQLPFTYIKCCV